MLFPAQFIQINNQPAIALLFGSILHQALHLFNGVRHPQVLFPDYFKAFFNVGIFFDLLFLVEPFADC